MDEITAKFVDTSYKQTILDAPNQNDGQNDYQRDNENNQVQDNDDQIQQVQDIISQGQDNETTANKTNLSNPSIGYQPQMIFQTGENQNGG